MNIDVVIPAYNEEKSIALVLQAIPKSLVRSIIVVDNNSNDATAQIAQENGAIVLSESFQGYGASCLKGIHYCENSQPPTDILVFLDGDFSDYPEEMPTLVEPLLTGECDFVIGSRVKSLREAGAMMPQQIFGNKLATFLVWIIYGKKFYDLGPFRAIKFPALQKLNMKDKTYGWTIEMQVKAIRQQLKWKEIPVRYRKRKGVSKISGTIKGSVKAGIKIITTIFKYG